MMQASGKPDVPVDPGFTQEALHKMNSRNISPADVQRALSDPEAVSLVESGNTRLDGKNGVTLIVDPVENVVVSVFRPASNQ